MQCVSKVSIELSVSSYSVTVTVQFFIYFQIIRNKHDGQRVILNVMNLDLSLHKVSVKVYLKFADEQWPSIFFHRGVMFNNLFLLSFPLHNISSKFSAFNKQRKQFPVRKAD